MARSHFNIFFLAQTGYILCDKVLAGGKLAVATLTRDRAFVTKINRFMAERIY
jgi:hypothetical protein